MKPESIHHALLEPARYRRVFDMLRKRAQHQSYRHYSFANHPELNLAWILDHERIVTRWILRKLKAREFRVSPAREARCLLGGKERLLYRLEWPDRILQTVLTEALTDCWESRFHDCLFSYRKGRSALRAIRKAVRAVCRNAPRPVYILKRDIKSYGDSIPHESLLAGVSSWLEGADPVVMDLVSQFIRFEYVALDGTTRAKSIGLPTGMPLNCVLENLYLSDLDRELGDDSTLSYLRYGDDIWVAATEKSDAQRAEAILDAGCSRKGLTWHAKKSLNLVLRQDCESGAGLPSGFATALRVPYLGVAIAEEGSIEIPAERVRLWRDALKRTLWKADKISRQLGLDRDGRVRQLVAFANHFMTRRRLGLPVLDHLLAVVSRDDFFIEIDRWVAQTLLSVCYGRYTKANFRKTSFGTLRSYGLVSLYLRRREIFKKAKRRRTAGTGRAP
jgi:hypothetical protein